MLSGTVINAPHNQKTADTMAKRIAESVGGMIAARVSPGR